MDVQIVMRGAPAALELDDLAAAPGAPDPAGSARFSELMNEPAGSKADEVAPAAAAGDVAAVGTDATLGDKILGGLQRVSSDMTQTWGQVGQALNGSGANLQMHELLKMQLGLASMSIQYELVNKAVSRSTQNIDQLVKLQ